MIIDNIEKLIIGIAIVTLLLIMCVAVDSATTITNMNESTNNINTSKVIMVNNSSYVVGVDNGSYFVVKSSDKIHTNKTKSKKKELPTISMWAKPSVRCGYSYKWYYRTFIDYCPNCHHYNCLLKNPKGVPENEYTCKYCDSDFDGVVGKEKYSWSHVYLTKA